MPKPFTEAELSNQFDEDLIWRRKELSDMKSAIKSADIAARSVLLRSLIAMAYAHWEGYVKFCAVKYFDYITLRKHPYSMFVRQFYINRFLNRLDALSKQKTSLQDKGVLIEEILGGLESRFSRINSDLIDTGSNLKADTVKDICVVCDVDGSHFEERKIFIDNILLRRRNSIAHGQWEVVEENEVDDLVANTLGIMEHFRTLLENKIYTKNFMAA